MRASDRDREAVAERLATALSEGRLDLAEHEKRLTAAMSARTVGQLRPLTADLPEQPPEAAVERSAGHAGSSWREWFDEWRYWLGGAVVMIGIWAVTSLSEGSPQRFWPLIPLGIWAAVIIAGLFWPDEDGKRDRKNGAGGKDGDSAG
ncbi:DUF1707 SHOCT-like domain-containing protein [Marinactinospora rubrisoli]|uniref:DUF1707 domain-containing protein n=1 Tax=Marinactinospora rubrisoli TaxID=2715399 RepID=A0ABW2KLK2_9ACTN